jgi:hypothetical protein
VEDTVAFCYLITTEVWMNYGKWILVLALGTAGTAQAAGIGVKAGSTGLGVDLGWAIAPTLGGRVGLAGMNFNAADIDTNNVHYEGKAKLANANLLLDWSPLGPFRLSGGFIANNNKLDLTGRPTSGAAPIPAGSSLSGEVKPERSFAPYLGVGYGNVWTKGINFYFDLGIMFQGTPQTSLSLNCGTASPAQCAAAQGQVEAERQRVQDKVDKYKYFPVGSVGITIGW